MVTWSEVASVESSLIQKGSMESELVVGASQSLEDSFQVPQDAEEKTDLQFPTNMSSK